MTDGSSYTLCTRSDLNGANDGAAAKEVILTVNGARYSVVVIKDGVDIYAYLNSCPHARTPLNWQADKFFDLSQTYLLCATHGATFDIASGRCVRGPAEGRALTPVAVRVEDDRIVTDLDAWPHS